MIVDLFCPDCIYMSAQAGVPYQYVPIPLLRIRDDGIYHFKCPKGHDSTVRLINLKFELLFENGIHAIVDGYNRDAVTSFVSALEEFYEFYFRVAARHLASPAYAVQEAWRTASRQSERQLGLYLASYSLLAHEPPAILENAAVEFRNKVVHRGYTPTDEESISFGNTVLTILDTAILSLRRIAQPSLLAVYDELLPPPPPEQEGNSEEELVGSINILTTVDIRFPRDRDERVGMLQKQIERVIDARRTERKMRPMSETEGKERRRTNSSRPPNESSR
jgi:hypothetical protein